MRKSFCSLISFLLFSLLACGAASAHWYVAPTGNDANNGSKRKPCSVSILVIPFSCGRDHTESLSFRHVQENPAR